MKNNRLSTLALLCAAVLFAACGGKQGHSHDHEHDHAHDHETHAAHSCDHEHDHAAHDHDGHDHASHSHESDEQHSHDDHNHDAHVAHDHEGHSHDAHSHEGHDHAAHEHDTHSHDAHAHDAHGHNHGEGIAFTKKQAEAAGLVVEEVAEVPFYDVIKTAGHLQAPVGDEAVVVATSAGVLYYTQPSLVEGQALSEGKAFAGISAKRLQDGDPLVKAKLAYETAKAEYERAERLVADKIVSAKEYEQIRLRYETAKTTYEGQAAGMTERGAALASPITGYVKQLLVPNGAHVEVGQPVAVVTQTRRLQLVAEVSERDFGQLAKVTKAHFRPTYSDKLYKTDELGGRLLAYGRSAVGAFVPVTFEVDNVGDLIAGSYAEVYLLTQPESGVVSVPVTALTEEQGLYFVYVQICAEEYEKRSVRIGRRNGERVEILHGLHHGERVVTHGAYHVKLASMSTAIPHGHSH